TFESSVKEIGDTREVYHRGQFHTNDPKRISCIPHPSENVVAKCPFIPRLVLGELLWPKKFPLRLVESLDEQSIIGQAPSRKALMDILVGYGTPPGYPPERFFLERFGEPLSRPRKRFSKSISRGIRGTFAMASGSGGRSIQG
ncbi:MAG: hypothetical protein V3U26_00115, partial [Dehalococcoidia bacterium]